MRYRLKAWLYKISTLLLIVVITSSLIYLTQLIKHPLTNLIFTLFLIILGLNLTVYLIKKNGTGLIFLVLLALFTFPLDNLGIGSWNKVFVFFLIGIIFELIYLLRIKAHKDRFLTVMSSIISVTALPLLISVLLSVEIVITFPLEFFNLVLIYFFFSMVFSFLTLLIWEGIRSLKFISRLRSYLEDLND